MKARAKVIFGSVAMLAIAAWSVALGLVDSREIGRSSPKEAANYRLPWRNFSETYVHGAVLGVVVGSTKAEAIQAAERAGLTVDPNGWGDNRAGGASLYDRPTLLATMLRQPSLNFSDEVDLRQGMTIHFRGDEYRRPLHQHGGNLGGSRIVRFPNKADSQLHMKKAAGLHRRPFSHQRSAVISRRSLPA
jgi:hypothetical protein